MNASWSFGFLRFSSFSFLMSLRLWDIWDLLFLFFVDALVDVGDPVGIQVEFPRRRMWIVLLLFVAKSLQEPFGHSLLPLFPLEKGYVNLNHGSFGSAPLEIHALGTQASMHMEANTDRFFRYEMYQKVEEFSMNFQVDVVRSIVANHVSANEEDIVFVINASHGVNAILRSLLLPSGSKFLYFNLAYTMVKNTLYYISEEFQNQLVEVNVTFPVSYAKIVGLVVEALEQNPGSGGWRS